VLLFVIMSSPNSYAAVSAAMGNHPLNVRKKQSTRWSSYKTPSDIKKTQKKGKVKLREVLINQEREYKRDSLDLHQGISDLLNFPRNAHTVHRISNFLAYKGSLSQDVQSNLVARIEDVVALVTMLVNCTNFETFTATLHMYLRTFHTESISICLMQFVKQWYARFFRHGRAQPSFDWSASLRTLVLQSGDCFEFSDFMSMCRSGLDGWKQHKHSDLFPMLGNFVSLLVTLGVAPQLANTTFDIGGFEVFKIKAWDLQSECMDFIEAVATTTLFLLERGHAAFTSGNPMAFLYTNNEAADIDCEFAVLTSAISLLESGGLEQLGNCRVPGISSVAEYDLRVEKLTSKLIRLRAFETNKMVQNTYASKIVAMTKVRSILIQEQNKSCVRMKPYAVQIFGPSAVGKTTLNNLIVKTILHSNGYPSTKDHHVVLNEADKFQSEFTTKHEAVTIDDFGNTRAEFYDAPPTRAIIDFVNNVPKAALKADLASKGNVMISPKVFTVTTNVKSLMGHVFSNEPVSIARRFNVVVTAELRESHIDSTGGPNASVMMADPDAWLLNVERVRIVRSASYHSDTFEYVPLLTKVGIVEVLEFLKQDSKEHFESQRVYVDSIEGVFGSNMCEHCLPSFICKECRKSPCEVQMGLEDLFNPLSGLDENDPEVKRRIRECLTGSRITPLQYAVGAIVNTSLDVVESHLAPRSTVLAALRDKWHCAAVAAIGATALAALTAYIAMRKTARCVEELHGAVMPVPHPTDEPNVWAKVLPVPVPCSDESVGITYDRLAQVVTRSIANIFVTVPGRPRQTTNIVPLMGNTWLVPGHLFSAGKSYEIEVRTVPLGCVGKNFRQVVDSSCWVQIPDTDFKIIRLVSGGDVPNLLKFVVTDFYRGTGFNFVSVVRDSLTGVCVTHKCKSDSLERINFKIDNVAYSYEGYWYHYAEPTKKGMCMATAVVMAPTPGIVGFHLAGNTGTSTSVMGAVSQRILVPAMCELDRNYGYRIMSAGQFLCKKYDVDFTPNSIDPKHPVNFLERGDCANDMDVFGGNPGGCARFLSGVRKSPISDLVSEVMDLPRLHGAPDTFHIKQHWRRDLSLIGSICGMLQPAILKRAVACYKDTLLRLMSPRILDLVHVYPNDAVVAGADGVPGVDRLDLSTSVGFPLNTCKKQYITESPRLVEGITAPLDVDPIFWDEVERIEECFLRGERIYTIFRGNLKDEPTKFGKKKIRVFSGAELAFTLVTRRYYLSIIRVLHKLNFRAETAVGVNAYGPHWTNLVRHFEQFEGDRYIAGDYKAFDKQVSPLVTFAVFEIYMEIAHMAGYTARDLTIMRGIATEICYPVMEFNGVFVGFRGSNPSGHSLTVDLNCGVNAIYNRYAFYAIKGADSEVKFTDRVINVNYGDDDVNKVHPDEIEFSHTTKAAELAKIGIVYTMPDKTGDSIPYVPLKDINFLKRSFRWEPELDNWVAPLEEASISKSLHNYMYRKKSPVLPEDIAVQAILGAHNEFFRHGREIFEIRRLQLLEVVERAGYQHAIPELLDWEQMKSNYFSKPARYDNLNRDFVQLELE